MNTIIGLRVVGLHKLPFDRTLFQKNLEDVAGHNPESVKAFEEQYKENWENAWIVVISWEGNQEIEFDQFAFPEPGPDAQVPWLELILDMENGKHRAAFFLHYVEPGMPLWYGDLMLAMPKPTPAPSEFLNRMIYSSPD